MAASRQQPTVEHLRRLVSALTGDRRSDRELLDAFASRHDEGAFSTLVSRHGRLVLAACRRILRNEQDAEDAFQATFLVLARKAGAVRWQEFVGSWLYHVAVRVSMKLRSQRMRRRTQPLESCAAEPPAPTAPPSAQDFQTMLDEELHELPARYHAPLVLCYLQGMTQDEAARALDWTAGSIRGRLNRGRDLLRQRLARRGVALSAVLFAAALAPPASTAPLPSLLLVTTVRSGLLFAAGAVEPGVLPATVLTLAEGVLYAMFVKKMQFTSLVLLALGLVGAGAGWFAAPALAERFAPAVAAADGSVAAPSDGRYRKPTGVQGRVSKIEAGRNPVAVTIVLGRGDDDDDDNDAAKTVRIAFDLARDAKVRVAGRPAELTDLKEGAPVTLELAADNRTVAAVHARGKIVAGAPGKMDAAKQELSLLSDDDEAARPPQTFRILKDAALYIDDFPAQVADLEDCDELEVELAADGQAVARVRGRWEKDGDIEGKVTAVDAAAGAVTLLVEGDDDVKQEYRLKVGATTKLHINGVASKVADLKPGYHAKVRGKDGDQLTALRAVIRAALDDNDD